MRLVNILTLEIESHSDDRTRPIYDILSHTWGQEEVSFQEWNTVLTLEKRKARRFPTDPLVELQVAEIKRRRGYKKVVKFCELTKRRQPRRQYVWVDTVCIDKTSSSELSEAINSMFRWYKESGICCVFLDDVPSGETVDDCPKFHNSRWFRRGWTLQELLAVNLLEFYDSSWKRLFERDSISKVVEDITGIEEMFLPYIKTEGPPVFFFIERMAPNEASLAKRMSWAASRETTRPEDMAYCLMGLFDVNMPLLYGEGGRKAFIRLQEEIMKQTEDLTLLSWGYRGSCTGHSHPGGVFADSPACFLRCGEVQPLQRTSSPLQMTNKGLQVSISNPISPGSHRNIFTWLGCTTTAALKLWLPCKFSSSNKGRQC
jgi:hypothetical protein